MYKTSLCNKVSNLSYGETSLDEPLCRICYSYENPLGSTKDLISPCGCKGTVKYVHGYCLQIWRFKGKMVKDIKFCEQCFCEYVIENERKTSSAMVSLSTVAVILSFLLTTNIFLSSTADTIAFINSDIKNAFFDSKAQHLLFSKAHILSEMDCIPASARKRAGYTVKKAAAGDGRLRMVCIADKPAPLFKSAHLFDPCKSAVFSSISVLAFVYALFFEKTFLLLFNIVPALWRILSFGTPIDWFVYISILLCAYLRMYARMYRHLDNYCMYVVNIY